MHLLTAPAVYDVAAVQHFTQAWETAWNNRDGQAVAALCSEELVYDEPALGKTVHGRDAIREFVTNLADSFPDYHFHLEGLYAEVTRPAVLVAWRLTGTLKGTDTTVEFHGDDRLEFGADGLIKAYRCLYDNKDVIDQIRAARSQ